MKKKAFMLHVPEELHEEVKGIADREMLSLSALCRMFVNNGVNDYRNLEQRADKRAEL
tara:strand:- start:270 stop:443 length:174 start_codon:yes stop_codon:yes gene_type:complete